MQSPLIKKLLPSLYIMAALLLLGGVLHLMGHPVYWPGFASMMCFYAVIFYIGTYAASMKGEENENSIMLAGRSIPLGVAVFTMSATWVGGGYINGTAEYTNSSGIAWVQAPWGYALSLIVGGLFFARKMRRYEFKTMIDPLQQRFGKKVAALLSLPAICGELFWTSAILTALGTTFGTVLGMDFVPSIIASAAIAIAYTALGGLWAVAFTDVIQMILLLIGLVLVIPFALDKVGGWDLAWKTYVEHKGILANALPPIDGWKHKSWGNYYWNWWDSALLLIFGGIPWQVYFQRVLASKNEKVAMRLSIIAGFVCMAAAIPAVMIGVIGHVAPWEALGVAPPQEAALTLPYVVRYLTNPFVATIGLGAIAAAVMSSVDSSILSASSMASWNIYRTLLKPKVDSKTLAKVIKRVIWIIGVAATLIALQVKSVYALWFLCSDFVYCILFPQLVCALFDKKANRYGAIAGLLVSLILRFGGGEATLGIPNIIPYPLIEDGNVLFPFRTTAMLSGLLTMVIVSRLSQKQCPPQPLHKLKQTITN
ncbi:sodium:solute symporter family protein [Porifericola rhodea]|uniref:sodium:solute symporter family protein n=1 Tax=Porifericola rhodea TaxID=930972 RepID=UPI002666679D|nr:sodium:solute symporter family protein [Porifericola rhodea]WKN31945.1 sodium:solute symporter family protein [Porifericola rhodea]